MPDALKHIGILLFPDVEELDAVGPWEVLSYWTRNHPEDGFAVTTLSQFGGLIECAKGLSIKAHCSYADAPPLDGERLHRISRLCGGRSIERAAGDDALVGARQARRARLDHRDSPGRPLR